MDSDWLLKVRPSRRRYLKLQYDEFHTGKTDFDELLKNHCFYCRCYLNRKRELKYPFVKKTGNPWAESTLRTKRASANAYKRDISEQNLLIRILMKEGYGLHKKKPVSNVVQLFPNGRYIPTTDQDTQYSKNTKLLLGTVQMYLNSEKKADSLQAEIEDLKKVIAGYQRKKPAPVLSLISGGRR